MVLFSFQTQKMGRYLYGAQFLSIFQCTIYKLLQIFLLTKLRLGASLWKIKDSVLILLNEENYIASTTVEIYCSCWQMMRKEILKPARYHKILFRFFCMRLLLFLYFALFNCLEIRFAGYQALFSKPQECCKCSEPVNFYDSMNTNSTNGTLDFTLDRF